MREDTRTNMGSLDKVAAGTHDARSMCAICCAENARLLKSVGQLWDTCKPVVLAAPQE